MAGPRRRSGSASGGFLEPPASRPPAGSLADLFPGFAFQELLRLNVPGSVLWGSVCSQNAGGCASASESKNPGRKCRGDQPQAGGSRGDDHRARPFRLALPGPLDLGLPTPTLRLCLREQPSDPPDTSQASGAFTTISQNLKFSILTLHGALGAEPPPTLALGLFSLHHHPCTGVSSCPAPVTCPVSLAST